MAKQPMLVGNCVLIVIDIQKSAFMDVKAGIPVMPGYADNMKRARRVVDAAHEAGTPVIFFQEIHRRNKIDYGRELDGNPYWRHDRCLRALYLRRCASERLLRAGGGRLCWRYITRCTSGLAKCNGVFANRRVAQCRGNHSRASAVKPGCGGVSDLCPRLP